MSNDNNDSKNIQKKYDTNTDKILDTTTNSEILCNKMIEATNIDDPITQKIAHKNILSKIKTDYKIKPEILHKFLLTSFKMFGYDDELYDICLNLLLNNVDKLDLSEFTGVILNMLEVPKYKNTARELIKLINTNDDERVKRIKRVSFKEEADIKYIKKEISLVKDLKEDKMFEKRRFDGLTQQIITVEFRKPIKMIQEYCKTSLESENQKIREQESILFVNTNINQKCEPTEISTENKNISNKNACVILPLVNLNVKNTWKTFDFVKILENKEFDINEILNDPKIIDEFATQ